MYINCTQKKSTEVTICHSLYNQSIWAVDSTLCTGWRGEMGQYNINENSK